MKFTVTDTAWVKFGKSDDFVLVGKDTIAMASGIYVYFFDLKTREKRIERFDDSTRGDGASCLAGHPTVPIFSMVERKPNPKVLVFAYPSIRRISSCLNSDEANGYLCSTFAGTEYLLGLTTFPKFRIIVWHWKTGEKATVVDTTIHVESQKIACSPGSPHLIAQFSPTTGELCVYRLLICSKIVRVLPIELRKLSARRLVSFSWSSEGNLFVCDDNRGVWSVDFDNDETSLVRSGDEESLETLKNISKRTPLLATYRGGVLVTNTPIDETNTHATFYRKSTHDGWQSMWTISLPSHPVSFLSHSRDGILIHADRGMIYEILCSPRDHAPRLDLLHSNGGNYVTLSIVHGRLCVLDERCHLFILDADTGNVVSTRSLKHHGQVTRLTSHPTLPVVATVSVDGNCLLLGVPTATCVDVSRCFHLQREPLDLAKFSVGGEILCVGNSDLGRIFFIYKLRVKGLLKVESRIADFLIYETEGVAKTLVLVNGAKMAPVAGKKIAIYSCDLAEDFQYSLDHVVELHVPFAILFYGLGKSEIFGVPYLSKQLHRINIENNFRELSLTEALPTLHQTRNIKLHVSSLNQQLITYGYDGLIVLRDGREPRRILAIFPAHHRSEGGVGNAIIIGNNVVSLGANGDLIANRLRIPEEKQDPDCLPEVPYLLPELSGESDNSDQEKTWMENSIRSRLLSEEREAQPIRISILSDLEKLRERVKCLLDSNEKESSDDRLPLCIYDLDRETRERRIWEANQQREEVLKNLEEQIARQNRAAFYLREKFWNPQIIRSCAILSIFGKSKVTNYPLTEIKMEEKDNQAWKRFSLEIKKMISRMQEENSDLNDSTVRGDARSILYSRANEEERACLSGTTSHKWIKDPTMELTHQLLNPRIGYVETLEANSVIETRQRELKLHFNSLFEEVRSSKKQEIEGMKKRVERMRYCANELKEVFGVNVKRNIIDVPEWHHSELPEYPITIIADEPSKDGSISKDTSEELKPPENSFHQEALEKMMDGVLEVRWEDEVKRDIPKPECLAKDPSKYTDKDLETIEIYRSKLRALQVEREKYKSMLETEMSRTEEELWESVKLFNEKLEDLGRKKIEIEQSILREELSRVRGVINHRKIVRVKREISRLIDQELTPSTKESRRLAEECNLLESTTTELRNRYEALCKREKLLEGKFRSEFTDLKQPMVEHLFRHYRRRPRAVRANCTSLTFLSELCKCLVSREKSEILPREWLEFLRSMDGMDQMPDGLPALIERHHWQNMCRLRRLKIETETKVRSCAVEVAEAEHTLAIHRKAALNARGKINRHRETLSDLERSMNDLTDDQEIQLVLKIGQLRVRASGTTSDWRDAILIPEEEVRQVKNAIMEAGDRKLRALRRDIELRKAIELEEWEHARMKMIMEDLRERLDDLRGVKVKKIISECVDRYPTGKIPVEEVEAFERNLLARQNKLFEATEKERNQLKKLTADVRSCRLRNEKLITQIEQCQSENQRGVIAAQQSSRLRSDDFRRRHMAAITSRWDLMTRIRENFEELLALRARLEILKLRTYPTLKFKL